MNIAPFGSACLVWLTLLVAPVAAAGPAFVLRFAPEVAREAVSGRAFVFLSQRDGEPRKGPDWFQPEPFFGLEVAKLAPGETVRIDGTAAGFPTSLDQLPAGRYRVQAVFDRKFHTQDHNSEPGNFYSQVSTWDHVAGGAETVELTLDQVVPEPEFKGSKYLHEVKFRSEMLSKFHGRDVFHLASVILPANYEEDPQRRYPVLFIIPGFSGDHRDALRYPPGGTKAGANEIDLIRVILNPQCAWGHHVFADSATNGPRGKALIEEFIPYLDQKFRTEGKPETRFLNGHSSGGWSSLWLQVTYPQHFGGVWSTSPDPVDFRDFQQVDLYYQPPLSLYYDEAKLKRPIARFGRKPALWYESFGKMDDVLYRGGQLRSFEAVFSLLDANGQPAKLWDRTTGRIDPVVADSWKPYDISLVLEKNWEQLAPHLKGKIHVFMGELDTFYLEGATHLLADRLKALNSDAQVTFIPEANHNLLTPALQARIRKEMAEQYQKTKQP